MESDSHANLILSHHYTFLIKQIFISISLQRNVESKKIYGCKFSETKTHPSEGVLGLALARSNNDWA